jgi:hypothetical protein
MRRPLTLLATIGLIASPWLGAAAQSNDDGSAQANQYEFASPSVSVYYSPSSFSGEAQLRYRRGNAAPLDFSGDEIRVERTEIGQLVSVTVQQVPDLKVVTLSLVIPDINLDTGAPTQFESSIIFTTNHTTIGGPELVKGPLQTYWSPGAIGQASSVEYLAGGETGVFGKLTQSPTCGGPQRPGQTCIGPLPGAAVLLLDGADQVVASAVSDDQGLFAIHAPAGDYTVEIDTAGAPLPSCPPTAVTVPARIVTVSIRCDTGIR